MSWKEIDEEPKQQEYPNQKEVDKFCDLCYQTFEVSISGKKLFEILMEHLQKPVCPLNVTPRQGDQREGENNLIRQFRDGILYHKQKEIKNG